MNLFRIEPCPEFLRWTTLNYGVFYNSKHLYNLVINYKLNDDVGFSDQNEICTDQNEICTDQNKIYTDENEIYSNQNEICTDQNKIYTYQNEILFLELDI